MLQDVMIIVGQSS